MEADFIPIFKAEIGDFLYIIIFAILMILGGLEKVLKSKRQQNVPPPPPPAPYDDFDDVDEQQERPKTLEEMMQQMMQTFDETPEPEPAPVPVYTAPVYIPEDVPKKVEYQPICDTWGSVGKKQFPQDSILEEKEEIFDSQGFDFDIRNAIIASEILNRRYG